MFMLKRDTCTIKLKELLDQKTMEEYEKLIKNVIESRHKRVLERQKAKYEVLHQHKIGSHSNKVYYTEKNNTNTCIEQQMHVPDSNNNTKKWVINLSSTPVTDNQERLLSWGPKFAI